MEPTTNHRNENEMISMYCGLMSNNSGELQHNIRLQSPPNNATNQRSYVGNNVAQQHRSVTSTAIQPQQSKSDYPPMSATGNAKSVVQSQMHPLGAQQGSIQNRTIANTEFNDIIHNYPTNSMRTLNDNIAGNDNHRRMKSSVTLDGNAVNHNMVHTSTNSVGNNTMHQATHGTMQQQAVLEALSNIERESCDYTSTNIAQTYSNLLQPQLVQNDQCQVAWQQQNTNTMATQNFNHHLINQPNMSHDGYNRLVQNDRQQPTANQQQPALQPSNHNIQHNLQGNSNNNARINEVPQQANNAPKNYNALNSSIHSSSLATINMQEFKRTSMPVSNAMHSSQGYMKTYHTPVRQPCADKSRLNQNEDGFGRQKEKKLTRTPIPSDAEKTSNSSGSGAETSPQHFVDHHENSTNQSRNVFELSFLSDPNKSTPIYGQQQILCNNNAQYANNNKKKSTEVQYNNPQRSAYMQNEQGSESRMKINQTSIPAFTQTKINETNNASFFQQNQKNELTNKNFSTANSELQHMRLIPQNQQNFNSKEFQTTYFGNQEQPGLHANHNNNANVKPAEPTNAQHKPQISTECSNTSYDQNIGNKQKKVKRNKTNGKSTKINENAVSESSFGPRLNAQATTILPKATADPVNKPKQYTLPPGQMEEMIKDQRKQFKKTKNAKRGVNNGAILSPGAGNITNQPTKQTVRQWQTVTAVQGPKLPPMLSEQDRIPKRGRPPKKMVQENLRVNKPAQEKTVAKPKPTKESTPPSSTAIDINQQSLVSMYTINDRGLMEEIMPKLKENKRSKERSVAFMNYLNEIKTSQKHKFGESCSTPNNEEAKQKGRKKPRSRTRVFGKTTAPITLSGFNETMCTFSELAQQYKISNSILSRATENLRKSAAASVARLQPEKLGPEHKSVLALGKSLTPTPSNIIPITSAVAVSPSLPPPVTTNPPPSAQKLQTTVPVLLPNKPSFNTPQSVPKTSPVPTDLVPVMQHVPKHHGVNRYSEKLKVKPKKKKKNKKKNDESKKKKNLKERKQKELTKSRDGSAKEKKHFGPRDDDNPEDVEYDAGDSLSESESISFTNYESKQNSIQPKPSVVTTSAVQSALSSNLSFKTAVFPTHSPFQDARENLAMQSKQLPKPTPASHPPEEVLFPLSDIRGKKHKHKKKKFPRKTKNNLDPKFIAIMDDLLNLFDANLKITSKICQPKNTASITTNIFSVKKSSNTPGHKALWSGKSAAKNRNTTATKPATVKNAQRNTSSNILKSSISSKNSTKFDQDTLSTLSAFCTLPFYQKYGYVSLPPPEPVMEVKNTKNENYPDEVQPPPPDSPTPSNSSNKTSRKRKRGWPLGKKRGGKRLNSLDHDSDVSRSPPATPEVHVAKEKPKKASTPVQSKATNKNKTLRLEAQSKQETPVQTDTKTKESPDKQPSDPQSNFDAIKAQIEQAIRSSLSAVPNISQDQISKTVESAIQTYIDNNPEQSSKAGNTKIDQPKPSKGSKTRKHKSGGKADSSNKQNDKDHSELNQGNNSPKATEKHPKKVWAWKHQDASVDEDKVEKHENKQRTSKKKIGRPRKIPVAMEDELPNKNRKTSKEKREDVKVCKKISVVDAKNAMQAFSLLSSTQRRIDKIDLEEPWFYENTSTGDHIMEAISSVVKQGLEKSNFLSEEEENSLIAKLLEDSTKPNEKVSTTAKKSLESVVEKLKNKQAQSLQNAAAALLQLQQGVPVASDGQFNVVSGRKTHAELKALQRKAMKFLAKKNEKRKSNITKMMHVTKHGKIIKGNKSRGRPKKNLKTFDEVEESEGGSKKKGRNKKSSFVPKKNTMVAKMFSKDEMEQPLMSSFVPSMLPTKPFLIAGLYSASYKLDDDGQNTNSNALESTSVLPPPLHAGLYMRDTLQDFQLPYDIWWMYRKRKITPSQDPSTQFQVITKNVYNCIRPTIDKEDHICECTQPIEGQQACGKHCLNRAVYTECSAKTCPMGEKCTNCVMQRRQWCASIQRFKTKDKGWGIKTLKPIKEGDFILEYVGEVVSENEFRRRTIEHYHACRDHYCVNLDNTRVIDGYRVGNEGRFVNHSCEPNCEMQKWLVCGEYRLGLFAKRELAENEELTYDYNFHAYNANQQQKCRCESRNCRGVITGRRQKLSNDIENNDNAKLSPSNTASSHDIALWMVKPTQHSVHLTEAETKLIQKTNLFLIRNIKQIQKNEFPLTSDSVKLNIQSALNDDNNFSNNDSTMPLNRNAKLKNVLEEIYDAIMNVEDENGNLLEIPIVKQKSPDDISNKDFGRIKKKIEMDEYSDLDEFGNDIMQTIKNIEKHYGKKSSEGRTLSFMRKVYSNARVMADVLLDDDFGGRRKSIRNAIRECEFDERKNEDFIRCICQIYKDEGVMVQCENCYVWQHCDCMGVKPDKIDKYLCEKCYPRHVPREVKVIPQPSNAQADHTYYITLVNNMDLLVKQGDCVYLTQGSNNGPPPATNDGDIDTDLLNIFRIEKLWTDESGRKFGYGHHFLRPYETHHAPNRTFYRNELFVSPLDEIVPLDAVVKTCCVMDLYTYCKGKPKGFDNKDIYICDFRVDKTARIFTRITKKKHTICTKPHVFDTYNVKLCPKKDFRPHHVPHNNKKLHHQTDTMHQVVEAVESIKPQDCAGDLPNSSHKKKDRLNNIAKKLLSRLPRQGVDVSYLLGS